MPGFQKRQRLARRAERKRNLSAWTASLRREFMQSLAPTRWEQVWCYICIIIELMYANVLSGAPALEGHDWSTLEVADLLI